MENYLEFIRSNNLMNKIFNKALELAKDGNKNNCMEYLNAYIQVIVEDTGLSKEDAKDRALSNLGYYAGYFNQEVMGLIYKFYDAEHPIFGTKAIDGILTPEEAYNIGLEASKSNKF